MSPLAILGGVLLVALALGFWWLRARGARRAGDAAADRLDTVADWQPSATRLLTAAERLAYKTLVRAVPGHMVLAKVPLARFLKVPTRHSYSEWLRRLGNQCADLVVCDMASEVIAVVSVEPAASPMSERAQKRHKRMARVLKAAHIPLHVWSDNALPTADRAREILLPKPAAALSGPEARPPAPTEPPMPSQPGTLDAADEREGALEPPPSTWFDEFTSGPVPLPPPRQRP